MKTIFLGGSSFVIPIVEVLVKYFDLSLVILKNENDPLCEFCLKNNIETKTIKNSEELEELIKLEKPTVGITADFGLIIPEKILEIIPNGILNIHPSLLPKYRGPTPVQTALLNGDSKTGVTLFKLDKEIDHGPIIAEEEFEIPNPYTSFDLLTALFKEGAKLIENNLEDYMNGDLTPINQQDKIATFTKTFSKKDGFINPESPFELKQLKNMIRAFYPWPGVWTEFDINDSNKKKLIKLLPNNEIQVEGKKPMNYTDFINGYKNGEKLLKKLNLN